MGLETTYKIKQREKYESDRYEFDFYVREESPGVRVWQTCPYVGPEAYDLGNIDNVLNSRDNNVDCILDPRNPFYTNCRNLSRERAKFRP